MVTLFILDPLTTGPWIAHGQALRMEARHELVMAQESSGASAEMLGLEERETVTIRTAKSDSTTLL